MARQRTTSRPNDALEEITPSLSAPSTAPCKSSTGATAASISRSSRITRSAARLAADSSSTASSGPPAQIISGPAPSRKRKAPVRRDRSQEELEHPALSSPPPRKTKKQRLVASSQPSATPAGAPRGSRSRTAMSQSGSSSRPSDGSRKTMANSPSGKAKPTRGGRATQDRVSVTQSPSPRRQKKRSNKPNSDLTMKDADEDISEAVGTEEPDASLSSDSHEETHRSADDEDDGDFNHGGLLGSRSPMGLQSTLRALSGMMSGMSSRLREILCNLRAKGDPSIQLIALQELSDLLLVSNEDNLSGQFSPDPYVKELVSLMQPDNIEEENPEIMLLACRCLANLMEALRGSVANVVYGGAVPILCQKLLDIQFIDLAEQALSTLAKISIDFPASIVREGGLTACLTYLDFFPTSTQRTAVSTAANCCRNLPRDSFPVVCDVMPILLNVLASNDPKVVEQGCLCVSRIVESFKHEPEKLEKLIEPAMLKSMLRLLLPGTTNLIGAHIHTQFLRVLAITSKASPRLSVELLKMDVVDTLFQTLTGVSPPEDAENTAMKIDNVLVMQALIHRPREQVFEALNVICELLPAVPERDVSQASRIKPPQARELVQKRRALLLDCKSELKRFSLVLLPVLTDAYSSTVNLGVRQLVLVAQHKMLHNLDAVLVKDSLRNVPYSSFLAAILSQKDHPTLVSLALRCAELLLRRLEDVYQHQFHREGVISEITKLAEGSLSTEKRRRSSKSSDAMGASCSLPRETKRSYSPVSNHGPDARNDNAGENDHDGEDSDCSEEINEDEEDEYAQGDDNEDVSESERSSSASDHRIVTDADEELNDQVVRDARAFLKVYEASNGKRMRAKAAEILAELQSLATELEAYYVGETSGDWDGLRCFQKLASYFDGDALKNITSSELLNSGIITVLLDIFSNSKASFMRDARAAFIQAFMNSAGPQSHSATMTPFGVLVQKLQDLLSRTEHYEVITVNHNSLENTRSNATYMLSKQLRLKLVAEDNSGIPRPYKNMLVSIHAIATFKSLDDFLRPRINLSDRPRSSRNRDTGLSQIPHASRLRDQFSESLDRTENKSSDRSQTTSRTNTSTLPGRPGTRGSNPWAAQSSGLSGPVDGFARFGRSGRRQTPGSEDDERQEALECADAKQLSDVEDEDVGEEGEEEVNAIFDDLDDDLSDDNMQDPSAVNMEVASSGKVTARKDDGTRVATPLQSTPASKSSSSGLTSALNSTGGGSLATAGRPFSSYAAAMASNPQDWHIEFTIGGHRMSNETTIYHAVHRNQESQAAGARSVWSAVHTVRFKRVPGPPPPEPSTVAAAFLESLKGGLHQMPSSLSKDSTTSPILRLLSVLYEMNATLDDIIAEHKLVVISPEPLAQFINTKLTAKLNRQLEEPLIVASNCLPSWSEDLARLFPFLFPFETRHLFLQSTAFGYSRAMMRWQNSSNGDDSRRDQRREDRPYLGRLQRQKVRISRTRILDSAMKVMELYGSSPSVLEVEYFEEVGTGLGPTLEFYSTVSKEFSKKKLKLWRENDSINKDEYSLSKRGLFPAPMSDKQAASESGKKQLHLFKILGKFVARSMLDSRIIDISFNPAFFRIADDSSMITPSLGTVKAVDPNLANSLLLLKRFAKAKNETEENNSLSPAQRSMTLANIQVDDVKVEDLGLDFTLPGYPSIELIENGSNIPVTIANVEVYVNRVIDLTLGSGVKRQVDAFRTGFSQVFPYTALRAFTPHELAMLFGRAEEDWSVETLMDSIKADHGFNMDSRSVRNLLQTMSELNKQQRRDFLQFVTGSPKLPIGGFKGLTPIFTVVCRPSEPPYTPDDYLPSVMTCVNYLKLPDYSSLEVLRKRLSVAIREGQGAFHLS